MSDATIGIRPLFLTRQNSGASSGQGKSDGNMASHLKLPFTGKLPQASAGRALVELWPGASQLALALAAHGSVSWDGIEAEANWPKGERARPHAEFTTLACSKQHHTIDLAGPDSDRRWLGAAQRTDDLAWCLAGCVAALEAGSAPSALYRLAP